MDVRTKYQRARVNRHAGHVVVKRTERLSYGLFAECRELVFRVYRALTIPNGDGESHSAVIRSKWIDPM